MRLFFPLLCLWCSLLAAAMPSIAAEAPLRIKITPETHTLRASQSGLHYQLSVSLPPGYARDIGKQYPVLYVLDGQRWFPDVVGHALNLYYQQQAPELIVVGISWVADDDTLAWLAEGEQPDFTTERQRDLSPYPTAGQADSGRAAQFLNTLRAEIVPFIETQYRAAPDERTLVGTELGGLFGYYALFQSTGLFNRYLITDPALVNEALAMTLEGQYAGQSDDLPARVFLAQQRGPQGTLLQQIASKLASRHYPGLTLHTQLMASGAGDDAKSALRFGLRFLFADPATALTASTRTD